MADTTLVFRENGVNDNKIGSTAESVGGYQELRA